MENGNLNQNNEIKITTRTKSKSKNLSEDLKKSSIKLIKSLSTHGLPNLFRTKHLSLKLFWFCLTLTSTCLSIYFIIQTLIDYFKFNVYTEVRLIDNFELNLPVLTICNKNQLSKLTNESLDYFNTILNNSMIFNDELNLSINDIKNKTLTTYEIEILHERVKSLRLALFDDPSQVKKLTKSIEEMLINNTYLNNFEWILNKDYGNCYQINYDSKLNINNDSYRRLEFYLGQPDIFDKLHIDKVIFVSIDSNLKYRYSSFDNVLEVYGGYETTVKISKSVFHKYPKPYSNCDFDLDEPISFEIQSNKYYQQIINANYSYSHDLCTVFCRYDYILTYHNCTYTRSSIRIPNIRYCKLKNKIDFILEENKMIENSFIKNQTIIKDCESKCPLECNRIKYDLSVVSEKELTNLFADSRRYILNKSGKLIHRTNNNNFKNDLVVLNIDFESLSYMSYKEYPTMTTYGLISSLGGTLGVFLGGLIFEIFFIT